MGFVELDVELWCQLTESLAQKTAGCSGTDDCHLGGIHNSQFIILIMRGERGRPSSVK